MMIDYSGQQIGSYRLLRRLGFGGFASVYLGQHVRIATQQAAIKLLHIIDVDTKMLEREAEIIAALVHPHIIRLFDYDFHDQSSDQKKPFLVMDYAPGGSLRARHPEGTRVPLPTVVQYVQEIAKALEYAHGKHVIHRDIKPHNILIGEQGELRLSDFGIALLLQTGRTTVAASGTAYYMAPEQSRGKPEKASDQYALGIMVYEWLCGKLPFSEGMDAYIVYQHIHEPIPPLREQLPTLPLAVEQVIMRALTKDPKGRFATVQEFATALAEASVPLHVSSPSAPSSSMPPVQKKPMGTLLAICTGHTDVVWSVAWSPDGSRVASAGDKTVRLWVARSGQLVYTCTGHTDVVWSVAWSPDGRCVASVSDDRTVRLWDAHARRLWRICTGHIGSVYDVAWSPDGNRVASASWDQTVRLWDTHSGQLLHTCAGHTGNVPSVAWSPDGRCVASASLDQTVRLWDTHFGEGLHTCTGHTDYVVSVAWSPDGRCVASASHDGTVRLWDAHSGQLLHTCAGHTDGVHDVAWSPDGRCVASASLDQTVRLWDTHFGEGLHTCTGHTDYVVSVAWSPDGRCVASASHDGTVRLWDAHSGQLLHTCAGHTDGVHDVAWSPDGRCVASASNDKTVRLWQGV